MAVLRCSAVVPDTFTGEEYNDMHFIYSLCSGNGRAAVVEYWQ
jgi:hypothetical protein